MRSRLGIIGRLAAHITALVLLVVVLFQGLPVPDAGPGVPPPHLPTAPMTPPEPSEPPAEPVPPSPVLPPEPPAAPVIVPPVLEPPVAPAVPETPPAIVPPVIQPPAPEVPFEPDAPGFTSPEPMVVEPTIPSEDNAPLLSDDIGIADAPADPEPASAPEDMPPLLNSEAYDFDSQAADAPEAAPESSPETPAPADTPAVEPPVSIDPVDAEPTVPVESPEPASDPEREPNDPAADASVITELSPAEPVVPVVPVEPSPEPVSEPAEASETEAAPAAPDADATPAASDEPAALQPDESGSLVVAESETGAAHPVAALAPLDNANLEVLGEDVYWLDAGPDLESELDGLSETAVLAVLTPEQELPLLLLRHPRMVLFPAEPDDLSPDAAEHFLAVAADGDAPLVAVNLPGARGGAFFKGAYLLVRRNLDIADALAEIEPELQLAGDSRDEIVHRLRRLDAPDLRRRYGSIQPVQPEPVEPAAP